MSFFIGTLAGAGTKRLHNVRQLQKLAVRHFRKKSRQIENGGGGTGRQPTHSNVNLQQPFTKADQPAAPMDLSRLVKPFVFTVGFSGAAFAGAAVWQYENLRNRIKDRKSAFDEILSAFTPQPKVAKAGDWREEMNKMWNSLTPGQRVFAPILAINVAVFIMWRVPSLTPFMLSRFASNPHAATKASTSLPMLLSAFSHYSAVHLALNMFCLHSFSTPMVQALGQEQFVGLYLSSAVVSSFASYFVKVVSGMPGFSLGASGAICTMIGCYGTLVPEAKLQIVFLPIVFTAATAIKGLMAIDTIGILARWHFFDHAAHLGGMLYGIWWCKQGHELVWGNRDSVMKAWHEFRTAKPPPSE